MLNRRSLALLPVLALIGLVLLLFLRGRSNGEDVAPQDSRPNDQSELIQPDLRDRPDANVKNEPGSSSENEGPEGSVEAVVYGPDGHLLKEGTVVVLSNHGVEYARLRDGKVQIDFPVGPARVFVFPAANTLAIAYSDIEVGEGKMVPVNLVLASADVAEVEIVDPHKAPLGGTIVELRLPIPAPQWLDTSGDVYRYENKSMRLALHGDKGSKRERLDATVALYSLHVDELILTWTTNRKGRISFSHLPGSAVTVRITPKNGPTTEHTIIPGQTNTIVLTK